MSAVVYRYWNEGLKDHLYTNDPNEIGTTTPGHTGHHGYKSEGEAFYVYSRPAPGLIPIYRYWNDRNHDHFYSNGEGNATVVGQVGSHNYKCEGILGYLSPTFFPGSIAVHRYWNGGLADHLYTTNVSEIGTTTFEKVGNHGYKYEGVLGYSFNRLSPIFRYWNEASRDHLYTSDAVEIGTTSPGQTGKHGYKSEGILCHLSPTPFPASVPIYRYWSGGNQDHLYTNNPAEIGTTTPGVTGNHGYTFESILGYAAGGDGQGLIPIFRYWNPASKDHLYTAGSAEIGTSAPGHQGNHGYVCEGILCHAFP